MNNFSPAEEQAELEKLARMLCRAINLALDPDALIAPGEAPRFLDGHLVNFAGVMPAWVRYLGAAKAMFDYMRRREELEMLQASDMDAV